MLLELQKTAKRIIYINPIINNDITSINTTFINEGVLMGTATYSYSFDDVNWSDWLNANDFIQSLALDESHSMTTCVRVLIDSHQKPNTTFTNTIYNYCGVESIMVNGNYHYVVGVEYYIDTNIISATNTLNTYDPYSGISNAHHIREQLCESINNANGKLSTYFATIPNKKTQSITFKSYRVFDALPPKELKVILDNDADYNSDVQSYQFYGDYENLEIEILISEFKRVFGDDVKPTPKDVIYINIFNKMFRIISAKENRDFVNKAVAYKLYLGKYTENVDINTTESKQDLENFTEFITYDLDESEEHYNEIEDANGIGDTFENTIDDKQSEVTNTNSKMIYASRGMKNVETKLKYNGIEFQRYMYHEPTITDYITKYKISNGDAYTTALWINPTDTSKTIKLLELSSETQYSELLYINSNGFLSMHLNTNVGKYITLQGTPITKNNYYGILFTRYKNTIVLKVLHYDNGTINIIQEIQDNDVQLPIPHNTMSICANPFNKVGNIRFMNKSITNNKILNYMVDYYPNTTDNIVIDNCTPTVTSSKLTIN